jgi:hypothetical protein
MESLGKAYGGSLLTSKPFFRSARVLNGHRANARIGKLHQNTRSGQSRLRAIHANRGSSWQCLVSGGFETKIRRADKAKPIQIKKFAIHTLGHEPSFSMSLHNVWNAAMNRHSGPEVGNAAVSVPSNAPGRTHALCHETTFSALQNTVR